VERDRRYARRRWRGAAGEKASLLMCPWYLQSLTFSSNDSLKFRNSNIHG